MGHELYPFANVFNLTYLRNFSAFLYFFFVHIIFYIKSLLYFFKKKMGVQLTTYISILYKNYINNKLISTILK